MPFKEFTGEVAPLEPEKKKNFVPFTGNVAPLDADIKPKKLVPFKGEVASFEEVEKQEEPSTISGRDQVARPPDTSSFGRELVKGVVGATKGITEGLPQVYGMEFGSRRIGSAQRQLEQFERVDKGQIKAVPDEKAPVADLDMYLRANPQQRAQMKAEAQSRYEQGFKDVREANRLYAQFQKDNAKYRGRTPDLTDVETVKDFGNWLAYNFGAGAVNLAPVMLAAITTGAPGALTVGTSLAYQETLSNRLQALEKEFKGKGLNDQQTAQRIADYLRKTKDVNAMVALGSGLLDMAGPVGTILRRQFVKEAGKEAGKEAVKYTSKKEAAKAAIKETPRQVLEEAATGAAQEATQIAGKRAVGEQKGDVLSPENIRDVLNAAAAEAAGGAAGAGVNVGTAVGRQYVQERAEKLATEELARQERQARVQRSMDTLGPVFNQLVQKFRSEGKSEAEAIREAGALVSQEGFDRELLGLEPGADRTGIPGIGDGRGEGVAAEPAALGPRGLDVTGGPAAVTREGEAVSQPALTQEESERLFADLEQNVRDTYPADVADLIVGQASEAVLDGANPQFAFDQAITAATEEVAGEPVRVEPTVAAEPSLAESTRVEPTLGVEPAAIEPARVEPTIGVEPTEVVTGEEPVVEPTEVAAEAGIPTEVPVVEEPTGAEEPVAAQPPAAEPVTLQTKGKRGRKPIERTPEQQAQYEEERRAQQGALRDAVRVAERAIKTVETPFDETQYDTPEALKTAVDARMNENTDALTQAYRIANDPRFRKNKAGQLARQLIESDNFTPRQREIALNRATRSPKLAKSEFLESTNQEVDATLAEFDGKTAASAMGYIIATGNAFERLLAARLRPFLSKVEVVVVTNPDTQVPASIRRDFDGSNGLYVESKGKQRIYLNAQPGFSGLSNTVLLHEALHGATMSKLNAWIKNRNAVDPGTRKAADEMQRIMTEAYKYYAVLFVGGKTDVVIDRLYDVGAFTDIKEFVAYGLSQPEMQDFLMQIPDSGTKFDNGYFSRFVESIKEMFKLPSSFRSAFESLVMVTDQLLETPRIAASEQTVANAAKRVSRIDKLKEKLELSNKATEINRSIGDLIMQTRNFSDALKLLKATYNALNVQSIRKIMPTLTTEDITRWVGDKVANIKNVNTAVQEMAAMRTRMIREFAEKIPEWVEFNKENEVAGRNLGDAMHLSTLEGVDPTLHKDLTDALQNDVEIQRLTKELNDPNTPAKSKPSLKGQITKRSDSIKAMYKIWDVLPQKAKDIYVMVRDQYKKTFDLHEQLLKDKIEQSNIPGDVNDASTPKGRLMAAITQSFQEARQLNVYFPLMRYGSHWLRVGQSKSKNSEFYMFESASARNKFMADRVEELQRAGDTRSEEQMLADMDLDVGDTIDGMRSQVVDSSLMLKNIFGLLDQNPLSDVEAVKDQIYQMYLMTLPEKDIRRRFTHRQGKTGFSADVIRNFIVSQHTAANQLSRLANADKIRNFIGAAYAELAGNPDKLKLSAFVDEVGLRATAELQPTYSAPGDINWDQLATVANQATFFYLLTSPKSALVQMTQLPTVGIPTLAAEFGTDEALKTVTRYGLTMYNKLGTSKTNDRGEIVTEWGAPSVNDSSYVRNHPDRAYRNILKRAWAYANDRNIFMETYAGDMTARGRVPSISYEGMLRKGTRATLNFISGAFHHSERIAREVMYMSTFELAFADAKKRGKSDQAAFDEATKRAVKIVYDSLFNYTQYNKPRVMKHPVGKVAFQFFTFPLQMTSYLVRNFFGMLPLLNKAEKRDAAIKFFGTMGMTGLFAGVVGLPMYSVIMGMAEGIRELFRPDMDDEEPNPYYDEDDDGNPLGKRNLDLWFREWFIPHYFGPDSDLAKAMGLTPEQALTLQRAVKMGPISAYTDLNIGASVSLDGLWFRNDITAETSKDALMQMAVNLFGGAFYSSLSQIISGVDDIKNGDMNRGVEKLVPFAFFRGAVKANRLSEEGLRTPTGAQVLSPEFYTTGKLIGESLSFGSTTAAEIQKKNILAKRLYKGVQVERDKLLNQFNKVVQRYADDPTDERLEDIMQMVEKVRKFNYKNGSIGMIPNETLMESVKSRMESRGRSFQGLSVPKKAERFIYPLVEKTRTE